MFRNLDKQIKGFRPERLSPLHIILEIHPLNDVTTLLFTEHPRPISKHLWRKILLDSIQPFPFQNKKCPARVTGLLAAVLIFRKGICKSLCFDYCQEQSFQEYLIIIIIMSVFLERFSM